MNDKTIIFAEELKKDCQILGEKLSFDEERINTLYSGTLESEKASVPLMKKVITSVVTIFIALLIGFSLLFIFLINDFIDDPFSPFIFGFSFIVYLIPSLIFRFMKKEVIAVILSVFGLFLITIAMIIDTQVDDGFGLLFFLLYCGIMAAAYILYSSRGLKTILFILFFLFLPFFIMENISFLYDTDLELSVMCYICMGVNAGLFFMALFLEKLYGPIEQRYFIHPLTYNTQFFFFFFFFFLTFIDRSDVSAMYVIHNILYFIFTTGTVIVLFKHDTKIMKQIALIYFCAYVFFKYYDLVWRLLHKSIVLIILGVVFITIATIAAFRWGVLKKDVQ